MDSDQNLATIKALLVALFTSSFVHVFSSSLVPHRGPRQYVRHGLLFHSANTVAFNLIPEAPFHHIIPIAANLCTDTI